MWVGVPSALPVVGQDVYRYARNTPRRAAVVILASPEAWPVDLVSARERAACPRGNRLRAGDACADVRYLVAKVIWSYGGTRN
eukprot:4281472-Alexandrium_andersonii.AAC.1